MYKQKVFVRKITIFADSEMVTIFWLVLAAKCYFEEKININFIKS